MSARIRTGYSFRRAAGSLADVIARIKECGWASAPITDTTTFGWVRWATLCKAEGLRPVFGAEIAVRIGEGDKKPVYDHWTFLARSDVSALNRLITLATEQFYYEPVLTVPQALSVPDLFVIYGHRTDPTKIPAGHAPLLAGLSPASAPGWIARAQAAGHAFIAVSANRYPTEAEKSLYEALAGKFTEQHTYPQHILSDREYRDTVPAELADHAFSVRGAVLSECNAVLPSGSLPTVERTRSLRTMCEAQMLIHGVFNKPEYSNRLDHELAVIESKGFADYFYIVADIVAHARKRMLVGPARGSSCGSLVCYLLGITTIDPIPFGLLFERFIDVSRDDLPDIDIDFSEQHRDLVFEYVRQRFGAECVARLGTVNFYQARSALKETCSALNLPSWTTEPITTIAEQHGIKKALLTRAGVKLLQDAPELAIASALENHPRHAGQHAAGVVITHGAVTDVVAVDRRTGATMCDKLDAEKLNLLKVDCLGLTQLAIFEHALHIAKLPREHLFQVSLDDPKAFAVLNAHHFAGVFQFNGQAVQNISKAINIESINDIVTITALARPGPLNAGADREWIRRRLKNEGEKSALDDLLPETFGLIVYQEQVMRVCREVAQMDWPAVNALRRIIARTQGVEELAKFREMFVAGAAKNMKHEQAEELWRHIVTFGGYGFNKSHSVAYSVISYWCCWLKAYHPIPYAAAMLSFVGEEQKLNMLREMEHEGTPFVAADPKLSTATWTVAWINGAQQLLGPLTNIVGIGPTHCAAIISARALGHELSGPVLKALDRCQFKIPNTTPIARRIEEIMPDPTARNVISTPRAIKDVQINGENYQVMVFGVVDRIKPRDNGALGLWINDDDDKIWCHIPSWHAGEITDRGRSGNALYALKGIVPKDFRCIRVEQIKYIGDMEQDEATSADDDRSHSDTSASAP